MTSKVLTKLLFSLGKANKDSDAQVEKIIAYCTRKNIMYKLPGIIARLEHMAQVKKHETSVQLTVPQALASQTQQDILTSLQIESSVPVQVTIDESVVGGFIAEYNNVRYDGSIAKQLVELEKNLAHD